MIRGQSVHVVETADCEFAIVFIGVNEERVSVRRLGG